MVTMARTPAAEVVAGEHAVRISSPDRVIYPATDATPEVTKLMVAQYVADVGEGLMRALRDRPTALERWPSGVHPGMRLAQGPFDKDADAFYQKRVPRGAPDYLETARITFPSGRTADEIFSGDVSPGSLTQLTPTHGQASRQGEGHPARPRAQGVEHGRRGLLDGEVRIEFSQRD